MKLKDEIKRDILNLSKSIRFEKTQGFPSLKSKFNTRWNEEYGGYVVKKSKVGMLKVFNLLDLILKNTSHDIKISENELKKKIEDILFELHFQENKDKDLYLEKRVKAFLEELKEVKNQVFFFRVYNLTTRKKIKFGDAFILPSEKSLIANIKQYFNAKYYGDLKINNANSCYFMIKIKQNSYHAEDYARELVRECIGCLSTMSGSPIFLDGEIPEGTNKIKYIE